MTRLLIPLLLLLAAVGLFLGFTRGKLDEITAQRADVAVYDEAIESGQKLIEVRDKLLAQYRALPDNGGEQLKKVLPDAIDNVRLIIDLDTIAGKYGMDLRNVRVLTSTGRNSRDTLGPDTKKYGSVGLGFSVNGTYDVFRRFVADLERSLRLTDVVAVSFSSGERDTYDYSVEIKTYWLK